MTILDKIEAVGFDVCNRRPTLNAADKARMVAPRGDAALAAVVGALKHAWHCVHRERGRVLREADDAVEVELLLRVPVSAARAARGARGGLRLLPARRRRGRRGGARRARSSRGIAGWRRELDAVYGDGAADAPGDRRALREAVRALRHPPRGHGSDHRRLRHGHREDPLRRLGRAARSTAIASPRRSGSCASRSSATRPRRRRRCADYAIDLGIALQLTNILRDVAEDAQRGRIYLPAEELRAFGVSEDELRSRHALAGVPAHDALPGLARALALSARPRRDRRPTSARSS